MTGPRTNLIRPVPDDFMAYAKGRNIWTLCKHYCTSHSTVARWVHETGAQVSVGSIKPIPDDFHQNCAGMTLSELIRHYVVDRKVIKRWVQESRCEPKTHVFTGPTRADSRFSARKPKQAKNLGQMGGGLKIHHDNRIKSLWDDAADTLRAERWAVYRCLPSGRYCATGDLWRVGNVVLTPDELLRRADKYRRRAA